VTKKKNSNSRVVRKKISERNKKPYPPPPFQVKGSVTKVPKYYYYGPRLTQILHARLRMRSSSLNEHLYIQILLIVLIVFVERLNLHIIIYLRACSILVNEIVFLEIYISATELSTFWIFTIIWQSWSWNQLKYYCFYDSAYIYFAK
jgi:hypothetical protein